MSRLPGSEPFDTGEVERAVYDALVDMRKKPWQPLMCRGFHECDLCRFGGEARGCANLIVPSDRTMYVAPELIVHCMNAHSYGANNGLDVTRLIRRMKRILSKWILRAPRPG